MSMLLGWNSITFISQYQCFCSCFGAYFFKEALLVSIKIIVLKFENLYRKGLIGVSWLPKTALIVVLFQKK